MKNQTQINEILSLLAQHSEARRALEWAQRFSWHLARPQGSRIYVPGQTSPPEIDAAQATLTALPLPERSEAIEACQAELAQIANRFEALRIELINAYQKQMEAQIDREAALIRLKYAETVGLLGISIKAARVALAAAEQRFTQAQTAARVVSNERTRLLDYCQTEYGTTPNAPASFTSAAGGRVDRLLGEGLEKREVTALLQKLGVAKLPAAFAGLAR